MAPKKGKKEGGGKKAGKASKLAKMNEQERVKYLERKMAEEEELRRRKEEMVSVFLKMKLSREEQKSGLNSSKLIDHWRGTRREIKTKELQSEMSVQKDAFERALLKKNRHIELLLQDLDEAEEQYNMGFRSQVDMMTQMLDVHDARISDLVNLHEDERQTLLKKSMKERKHMDKNQDAIEHYLDDVVIALNQRHANLEMEIKGEYNGIKDEVRNKNLEEKQALQLFLEENMDNFWRRLQKMVMDFKTDTEEKRRNYNELLSKDKKGVAEVAENNKKIQRLMEDVGKLKETLSELGDTEEKRLSGLRVEREELSKELHSTRRSVSIDFRNREQKKMQKLAVHTDLLQKKVDEILFHQDQMIKLSQNCLKLESENDRETIERTNALDFDDEDEKVLRKVDRILTRNNPFFKNLDLIFAKQNQVSIQMALLKHEQKQLTEENDDLTVIMREVFHNLATSSDLAGDGLLSAHKKKMTKQRRKKKKAKPISYRGLLLSKDVMMEADIRPFSASPGPRRI